MKILGSVLVILYSGLMLYAICREKPKSMSSAVIGIGCLSALAYLLLNLVYSKNLIIILIAGMICISAGALMNGFRQKKVHVPHHIIRLILEIIITTICWIGG